MNKIKYLGIALAATLASCSTNDFDTAPAINGNGMITAYTPQSGESTRTAYEADGSNLKVTWSASDENMYTINAATDGWTAGQLKQVSAAENGASANFNAYDIDGTKQVGYKAGKLFAFYPQNTTVASSFTSLSSDGTTATIPLSLTGQSGKLTDLHSYDYMTATADVSVNADNEATVGALNMNHEIAVLHIAQGSEVSLTSGSVTKIELSATSGFCGSGTMTITRNGSTISSNVTGATGTITINGNFAVADNKLSDDVYVAILPTASFSGLKAKFTYSNGDAYTYNYTGKTNKFEKGKVYNWSPEIAAADKEFTLSGISQTGKRRTTIANKDINKWYCKYTIDGLLIDTSTNEQKVAFTLKIGSSTLAKNMTFNLISSKGVYRLWNKETVDLDIKSFNINWYGNNSFTGSSTTVPDASHLYGKCEVVLKDLKDNGSDFYKQLVKSCSFTLKSNYGKEQTISIQAFNRSLTWTRYKDAYRNNTILKYQLPDNSWKEITIGTYEQLRDE